MQSAIPELENATAAAKANLDLAQTTFKRMEELAAKKSISNQEMDEASARLKAAQANYDMVRSRRAQVDSKMAVVEQEVRAAGIMRDYAKLAAPFSGVVITRSVEPGNLATPGAPLLTIEQDGLYRLEASVDESKLASVRVGQAVEVVIDASDRKLNARVSEIVPSVDAASRTYIVKVDLPADAAVAHRYVRAGHLPTRRAKGGGRPAGRPDGARPAAIGIRGGRWRGAHQAGHHGTAHRRCGGSPVRPERQEKGSWCPCLRACRTAHG